MGRWKKIIVALSMVICLGSTIPAHALDLFPPCEGDTASAVCRGSGDNLFTSIKQLIDLLLFMLGALAVLISIFAGLKYVASRGDPAAVKQAKDTLTYALVGLVVAILARPIVNFVISVFQ